MALEVRHINRGREVRDISFSVKKGEILGFAGLMGAGRTEVARAIFGADRRDGGEILIHGKPVDIRTPWDAVRAGIGYLARGPQAFRPRHRPRRPQQHRAGARSSASPGPGGILDDAKMREMAEEYIRQLSIKTPSDTQEARASLRRQPAEGGHRQVAAARLRHPDLR